MRVWVRNIVLAALAVVILVAIMSIVAVSLPGSSSSSRITIDANSPSVPAAR